MRAVIVAFSTIATAAAAPAIVWRNGATSPQHSSETIGASSLLKSTVEGHKRDASSLDVVFVVGRDRDGSEALSGLAQSGKLPRTKSKYESAHSIHHHVGGVESHKSVARDLGAALGPHAASAMEEIAMVSLSEFKSMMTSSELPSAAVVSVHKSEAEALDEAVESAVENSKIHSVVLTAQRSVDEVKHERALIQRRNKAARVQKKVVDPSRRRLEDQDEDGDEDEDQNDNQNNNWNQQNAEVEEGVYYVNMTPNILAGVLFTIFFILVTQLGLNCMGMISNSDVFVSKVPSVGREV